MDPAQYIGVGLPQSVEIQRLQKGVTLGQIEGGQLRQGGHLRRCRHGDGFALGHGGCQR